MAWFVSNFLVNTGSGQSVATNCWIYMNAHMLVYSVQYICAANEPGKTKGALWQQGTVSLSVVTSVIGRTGAS